MKKIIRILLGAFFMLSAAAKLSSMESFELYMFSFGFFSFDLSSLAARAIVIAEFLTGAGLASGIMYRLSRLTTAAFLLLFSCFLIWKIALGDTDSCHCMGDLADMDPLQSLLKNAALALLLAYSWKAEPKRSLRREGLVGVLISALSTAAVFIITPPDMYYRAGRSSSDLDMEAFTPVADSLGLSDGRRVVCFYSGSCEHCRHSASKMAGIIRRHALPEDSISVLFMQTHVNQDSVATDFFVNHGEGMLLPYNSLHPYVFLPLTNGSMPLVVLLEDGRLVKEFDYLSLDERELSDFINRK